MSFIPDLRGTGRPSLPPTYNVISADGAVAPVSGIVYVTKGTACIMTIASPPTSANGATLTVISTTAAAHTLTYATVGFNDAGAGGDVGTWAAAKGNHLTLTAYNGIWYVLNNVGVTIA